MTAAKTSRLLVAGAIMVAGATMWLPVAAQTDASVPFTAVAVAEGVRKSVGVPPDITLFESLADPGAPVAQAQMTLFGGNAFASNAYPGDTAANAPQLAAAAGLPVTPDYPFYVHAEHPLAPSKRVDGPAGYSMQATAGAATASASATTGGSPSADSRAGRSHSETTIGADERGVVVARAESLTEDARFGGLRMGTVHSVAVARWAPGGTPTFERSTRVEGASVNGIPIEIGPDGARLGETVSPLPAGNDTVDELLAGQGITVRTIEDPADGGRGGHVVEVVVSQHVDTPVAPAGATVRYRIGGTRASVEPGTALGTPTSGGPPSPDISAPTPGATVTDFTSGAMAAPGVVSSPPPPPAANAAPTTAAARLRLARDLNEVVGDFYLVLLLTALAASAVALTWRSTGVQRTWNS